MSENTGMYASHLVLVKLEVLTVEAGRVADVPAWPVPPGAELGLPGAKVFACIWQ